MMVTDYHYNRLGVLRSGIGVAIYPMEVLAGLPSMMLRRGTEVFSSQQVLLQENSRLRAKQVLLEQKLQKLAVLEHENDRLRKLLASTKSLRKEQVLIAELISVDLDPFRHRVVLNKGTQDGVYEGQPLLGPQGIIGQVDKTSLMHSVAILISDPNHALLGVVARSGHRSLVVGTGNADRLELQHVVNTTDIVVGDLITTSGLDGRYPSDYPVAEITNISAIPGESFLRVEAKPLMNLNAIQEILLVLTDNQLSSSVAKNQTEAQ